MSACGTTCGITKERAKDLVRARALAEQVHPHLVWSKQIAAPAVPHDALRALEPQAIRQHARRFGRDVFRRKIKAYIDTCVAELSGKRETATRFPEAAE